MSDSNPRTLGVQALYDAIVGWEGVTVTVAGHPMFFVSENAVGNRVKLHADPDHPGNGDAQVVVKLSQKHDERVHRSKVVVVRGTFKKGSVKSEVELVDGELVEIRDDMPPRVDRVTTDNASTHDVVPCDQLAEAARGLMGQRVRVRGWYNGWTTSDTGSRVIHRIDMHDADTELKGIGIELREQPPEDLGKPGRIHIVEGQVDGRITSMIKLVDGEIVETDV